MRNLLFVTCLLVVGCAGAASGTEYRLHYFDPVARQMLINALKARSIVYRVDQEGGVWYPAKDVKIADEVAEDILKKRFGPAVSYEDPADMDLLRKKLNAAGIRYEIKLQNGREKVAWLKEEQKRVEAILEEVDKASMERAMAARALNRQQPTASSGLAK